MNTLFADVAVSLAACKTNPLAVLKKANKRPVAVLKHGRPAFYLVEPRLFKAMLEEIADHDLCLKSVGRVANQSQAVEVDLADL